MSAVLLSVLEASAPACGRRVCAWCVPPRDLGPAPGLEAGKTTHGMCRECQVREFGEVAVNSIQSPEGEKP